MRKFTIIASFCLLTTTLHFQAQSQSLVESELLSTTPVFLLGAFTNLPVLYDVRYYKITYNTVDPFGQPTIASGAVGLPVANATCNSYPIAAYCHGTVLRQNDVPSEENFEGLITKVAASTGYVVFAPDYLGLGDNLGIHPYIHSETQATATLDMIPAVHEFLATLSDGVSGNGQVFVTGYSQGGHAAMATLKYAQDNNLLDELNIVAGAPCSGPYALSESQTETLLSEEPYTNPGYVVYLLIGYQYVYGNLYTNLSDVIQEPYASLVESYFTTDQTTSDMGIVNALLPSTISELMVDTVLENFTNNLNHPLRLALADNDNFDWNPSFPLRMYYCDGDEQVAFGNSITAVTTMQANGSANVDAVNVVPGATHVACVTPALQEVFEFFASIDQACSNTTGLQDIARINLRVYPNPTRGEIRFEALSRQAQAYVQDMAGRILITKIVPAGQSNLSLNSLAPGQYIVSLWDGTAVHQSKLTVIQ